MLRGTADTERNGKIIWNNKVPEPQIWWKKTITYAHKKLNKHQAGEIQKRYTSRCMLAKLRKPKRENFEGSNRKIIIINKATTITLTVDLCQIMETRSQWDDDICKVLKQNCQWRILYPVLQKIRQNKDIPKQTQRIHYYHQTCLL